MRVYVTGDRGFIGSNLPKSFEKLGHYVVPSNHALSSDLKFTNKGEVCIYKNSREDWVNFLKEAGIDVIVHNAAVVGTDVVALSQNESTLTNVAGTHNICLAARDLDIPVCFMGTTVIYDTALYQSVPIVEESLVRPTTFYGIQKLAGEHILKSTASRWMIMRPLFAYGGVGDMNSLIAKAFYAFHRGKTELDMFLDPFKRKDYMHVEDFCDAVAIGCSNRLWGHEFNISANEPLSTCDIVDIMSKTCMGNIEDILRWHPETDYLGNHILLSDKFRHMTGWSPQISLEEGIIRSWEKIRNDNTAYNPLVHLDEANKKGTDLLEFFPKGL